MIEASLDIILHPDSQNRLFQKKNFNHSKHVGLLMSPVSWSQDPRGILQSVLAEARKPRPAKQLWPISNALQAVGASLQTSAEFRRVE